MPSKLAILVLSLAISSKTLAQTEWMFFGGPQLERANYHAPMNTDRAGPSSSYKLLLEGGTGSGWYLGAGIRVGRGVTKFRSGLSYSHSVVDVPYVVSASSGGHGGGSSSMSTGRYIDRVTLAETPLLISFGSPKFRFEWGLVPWLLLDASRQDEGIRTWSWWNMLPASDSGSTSYNTSGNVRKTLSHYGVMFSAGFSATIKQKLLLGLNGQISLPRTYEHDVRYSVSRTIGRVSVGYVFGKL